MTAPFDVMPIDKGIAGVSRQADAISCHSLKINNRKLEAQMKEILQWTPYASVEECLLERVAKDHQAVLQGRKLL